MYYPTVCVCFNVQATEIINILKFYDSVEKVIDVTNAGTKCKRCLPRIHQMKKDLHEINS